MRIRTGVVGVGRVGAQHARILAALPRSRLVGVCDAVRERAGRVAAAVGACAFTDPGELFAACDAVVVAVPTALHARTAAAALRAGCHVLVEKPLTATLEEADALIALAAELRLCLTVGHVERFNPALRAARRFLDSPRFIESHRLAPFQLRGTEVPVVLDLMIHDIDLVLGLVEAPVRSLHAVGIPVLTDSVDVANARLVFEDEAVADITASRVSLERMRKLRVWQPTGYLSLDLGDGQGEFFRRRAGLFPHRTAEPGLWDVVERIPLAGAPAEPLRLELEAFLAAAAGAPSEAVPARAGRDALEVALRIEREIERQTHVAAAHS